MKYNVHLYVQARVMLEGIEAESQEEAVKLAEERFDSTHFFHGDDSRETAQYEEGPALGALVDEEGDGDYYIHTRYHSLAERSLSINDWEETGGDKDPKSRLMTDIKVCGVPMHLEAYEVVGETEHEQTASNILFADDIERFQDIMDTSFRTAIIGGRTYVLIATPYGT